MNRTYETFPKYDSINGIIGRIYAQPKSRIARRGSIARAKAAARAFLNKIKANRACRAAGLSIAVSGGAAAVALLEIGFLSVLPALMLGAFSAGLLLLFVPRKKDNR